MKPKRTHIDYLLDILDNVSKAERFVAGTTFDEFKTNDEKVYAVVHALQTIGEAARHLPNGLRQHYREVDWDDVVGMRDIVIHEYFGVDLEIIWLTVHKDLQPLRTIVGRMLDDLNESEENQAHE